jgi:hypothetical protein
MGFFRWLAEQDALAKVINGVKLWLNTEDPRLSSDALNVLSKK